MCRVLIEWSGWDPRNVIKRIASWFRFPFASQWTWITFRAIYQRCTALSVTSSAASPCCCPFWFPKRCASTHHPSQLSPWWVTWIVKSRSYFSKRLQYSWNLLDYSSYSSIISGFLRYSCPISGIASCLPPGKRSSWGPNFLFKTLPLIEALFCLTITTSHDF